MDTAITVLMSATAFTVFYKIGQNLPPLTKPQAQPPSPPAPTPSHSHVPRGLDSGNYSQPLELRQALQRCMRDCESMRSLLLRTQRANGKMASALTCSLKALMNLDYADEQSIQDEVDGIMDVVLGRRFQGYGLAWAEAFDAMERDTFLGVESLRRYVEEENKKKGGSLGAPEM